VSHTPCAVTPQPPQQAACRFSAWRWRASVCLAGMGGHFALITLGCYPLCHRVHGTSTAAKGSRGQSPGRGSVRRWSPNSTRTPLGARAAKTARRLCSVSDANATGKMREGRLRRSVGVQSPTTSIGMHSRRSTIRSRIDCASRQAPTSTTRTSVCTVHRPSRGSRPPRI
jgi:hypothetical protein